MYKFMSNMNDYNTNNKLSDLLESLSKSINDITEMRDQLDNLSKVPLDVLQKSKKRKNLEKSEICFNTKAFKDIVQKIKYKSYGIYEKSCDISCIIQEDLVRNCSHNYEPDPSYYDPCCTIKTCKKCGDVW